jgi:hypothetical protein
VWRCQYRRCAIGQTAPLHLRVEGATRNIERSNRPMCQYRSQNPRVIVTRRNKSVFFYHGNVDFATTQNTSDTPISVF